MKLALIKFFLFWVVLTVLLHYLPLPERIVSQYSHLIFIIVAGIYLLTASSLAHGVIAASFSLGKRDALLYFSIVILVAFGVVGGTWYFGRLGIWGSSLATANLLFGATLLGGLLSVAISRLGELVPVCLTAAVADVMSVAKGPTKAMIGEVAAYYEGGMEGSPPAVDYILIKVGVPGYDMAVPLFGVTDWIFLVLLSSALLRLQKTDNIFADRKPLGLRFFFPVSALGLYCGLIVAHFAKGFIPAMVFMAGFFLLFLATKYELLKKLRKLDIFYSCIFSLSVALLLLLYANTAQGRL